MAGSALIGALRVTLGLDSAAFEAGMTKSSRQVKEFRHEVTEQVEGIKESVETLKGTLEALGLAFVIEGVTEAMHEGLEYAASLKEVSEKLGVTTEALQQYRYVASQVGVSQEEMDSGLQRLTRSIGMAGEGSKKQVAAFGALGVSFKDANGNLRDAGEVLPDLITKLSGIESPAQRAALEVALFGKAGQQLDPLLHGGIDRVNELKKAASDLGIVLSEEQIENADKTAHKLAELQNVLKANIAGVIADNAGAILNFANQLEHLIGVVARLPQLQQRLNIFETQAQSKFQSAFGFITGNAQFSAYGQENALKAQEMRMNLIAQRYAGLLPPVESKEGGGGEGGEGGGGGGGGGGGRPRRRASSGGGRGSTSAAHPLQDLLDSLLPDNAEREKLRKDAETLRTALLHGGLPQDVYDQALAAIGEKSDSSSVLKGHAPAIADTDLTIDTKPLEASMGEVSHLLDGVHTQTGLLSRGFLEAAQTGERAFEDLANSIKGGNLLDIFGSLLNMFEQLGSVGVFGKSVQTNLRTGLAGARATGGPVDAGRTYLVGERGPELFTPPGAGRIMPNGGFGTGGNVINFDARNAVMTPDLLAQMGVIAATTGGRMITDNNASQARAARRTLRR